MKYNKTYIAKPKYYKGNTVFIFKRMNGSLAVGYILNLDTWKRNTTQIRISVLRERFEVSPVQMG